MLFNVCYYCDLVGVIVVNLGLFISIVVALSWVIWRLWLFTDLDWLVGMVFG